MRKTGSGKTVSQKSTAARPTAGAGPWLLGVDDEIRGRVQELFTERNLELVEQFGTRHGAYSLLAMNKAGELFTWNDTADKLQPVTLTQSVRFHAREQGRSYEGTHDRGVRKRWLLMVAKAMEGRSR